jgi:hypothetical protein
MAAEVLDGETVRRWWRLSVDALARARAAIDALNVFPVPDSDTGTNLHLTLVAAAEAVEPLPPAAGPGDRPAAFEVPAPRPAPAAAAGAPVAAEPASSGYEVTYLLEAPAGLVPLLIGVE